MDEQERYPFLYIPCYVQELSREWEKVLHLGEKCTYKKGETFSLWQKVHCFGYIQSGLTCCYIREQVGLVDEIRFFIGKGCLIKETFVSAGYGEYQTYHKCLSDVVLYQFDKSIISTSTFLHFHPECVQNYIFSLSAKSISAQLFASLLKQRSNTQKLAVYLYGFYLLNNKTLTFQPPLSQIQLAELLGLSKLTVNRIIGRWKQEKIIGGYTKHTFTILNIEKLRALRTDME